jgi:hypothetical protein
MVRRRLEASTQVARRSHDGAHMGEDTVPTMGCSIMVLCQLALEHPGHEMETSTYH